MLLQLPISPHEREKEKERSYFSVGPGGSFLSLSSRRARVRADTEDELMARQPVTQTVRILFLSLLSALQRLLLQQQASLSFFKLRFAYK
jgi:hypothetical protein